MAKIYENVFSQAKVVPKKIIRPQHAFVLVLKTLFKCNVSRSLALLQIVLLSFVHIFYICVKHESFITCFDVRTFFKSLANLKKMKWSINRGFPLILTLVEHFQNTLPEEHSFKKINIRNFQKKVRKSYKSWCESSNIYNQSGTVQFMKKIIIQLRHSCPKKNWKIYIFQLIFPIFRVIELKGYL